jgi:hypothetical protein
VYNKDSLLLINVKFKANNGKEQERILNESIRNKISKFLKDLNKQKQCTTTNFFVDENKANSGVNIIKKGTQISLKTHEINNMTIPNLGKPGTSQSTGNSILFNKLIINDLKIFILTTGKAEVQFVGLFSIKTKSYIIKLYLMHMFTAFINFSGDMVHNMNHKMKYEELYRYSIDREKNILSHDFIGLKIFEVFNVFKIFRFIL